MADEGRLTNEQCFAIWAPDGVTWSRWAKPVTFTQVNDAVIVGDEPLSWDTPELHAVPSPTGRALVVDLSGPDAVRLAVGLARIGYRPVPLFNATTGPSQLIPIEPIARRLSEGAPLLQEARLPPGAPPVFLLDAERLEPRVIPAPGKWDNRWVTLPQDFPSATFLLAHGIAEIVLLRKGGGPPHQDLAHVLRRWQDAGIALKTLDLSGPGDPEPLQVGRPSLFRRAWYGVVALLDLRRSDVGGFGGAIPDDTERGGGFYGGFG